ncbi:MAG: family 10 glycosylhydrolase [Bacillota bacterium]|nr:family 10 glycosylhydrolase [Bacillota bacterium]
MLSEKARALLALTLSVLLLTGILTSLPIMKQEAQASKSYFTGVWVATVQNINFPSKQGLSVDEMKKEIIHILDTAKDTGINAVFFQVRPSADALYKSDIFPWSVYLTGKQGEAPDNGFDPLKYACDEAKKRDIEIHAWINPYRVTSASGMKLSDLCETSPARKNPNLVREFADGKLYFDPGDPASTQLVIDGVREIVKNYDVAGIHFDDYFYPYSSKSDFNDSDTYQKYGGGLSKADWRRKNINELIERTNREIKRIKPSVKFGVSPPGVWANKKDNPLGSDTSGYESYNQSFADSRKWVKDHSVDYIIPQIYWPIGDKNCDYQKLVNWWSDTVKDTGVDLYIGHAAYKVGGDTAPQWKDADELSKEISVNKTRPEVKGSVFYGYSSISDNVLGIKDSLESLFRDSSPIRDLAFSYPKSGSSVSSSKSYVIGSSDPRAPLYLNGKEVQRTKSGYFEAYLDLKTGNNTYQFTYNGKQYSYCLKRNGAKQADSYQMSTLGFKPGSLSPSSNQYLNVGEYLTLSCIAPKGAIVAAKLSETISILKEGDAVPSGGMALARYSSSFKIPRTSIAGTKSLGKPVFMVSNDAGSFSEQADGEVFAVNLSQTLHGTILKNDTIMRTTNSGSADRITPLAKNVTDYIVDESPDFYKLRYGGWTLKENVKVHDKKLKDNSISSIYEKRKANSTEIIWKMPVHAPYKIETGSSYFKITFYNTTGKKAFNISKENELFSSITYSQSGNNAIYTLDLKNADGLYGYKINCASGKTIIAFKNPPKLKNGLKPLLGKTVVIDAGHGGSDCGALGPEGELGRNEKNLNYSVADEVKSQLESLGAKVIMTRSGDDDVTLNERVALTRKTNPDLFVSIHHNSLDSSVDIKNYSGIITLYSEDFSKAFADIMQKSLIDTVGRKDGGVRFQGLAVCRVTECPSILIEMGYISNPYEFEDLSNTDIIKLQAQGIANGVKDYLNK